MRNYIKEIVRKILPYKTRLFLWGITPKISVYSVYKIIKNKPFDRLTKIDDKFKIKDINQCSKEAIIKAYSSMAFNYYEKDVLPRLSDSRWVGFAVENSENNEIAYISWVVKSNINFIDDINIFLKPNQFFLRDAFCVPEYRKRGLNTRIDEERINYCIRNGANEIMFQIGEKAHPEQNILRRYTEYTHDSSISETGINIRLIQKNYILIIPRLGIHRDLFSFLKNPFNRN